MTLTEDQIAESIADSLQKLSQERERLAQARELLLSPFATAGRPPLAHIGRALERISANPGVSSRELKIAPHIVAYLKTHGWIALYGKGWRAVA